MSEKSHPFLKLSQDLFFLWVVIGGAWGYFFPKFAASGRGQIAIALGIIMLGMGLTITPQQLQNLRSAGKSLLIGVVLQFTVMPVLAWLIASALNLPPMLALGVILVGASPGGTASNVVTFLAQGDVALSVALTTVSTLISPLLTPVWIWLLAAQWIQIEPMSLFITTLQIVLLPVLLGIIIRRFWTPSNLLMEGIFPLISMGAIAWIIGVIVGLNRDRLFVAPLVIIAVMIHNLGGLALGYWGAKVTSASVATRRTIAIEVGMQNSGLAVAIAVAHFEPAAAIPGAIFSVFHNLSGSLMAVIWRYLGDRE